MSCRSLEEDVELERLLLREAKSQLEALEKLSRAAAALPRRVASIQSTIQKLQRRGVKEPFEMEKLWEDVRDLTSDSQKAKRLKESLYGVCKQLQEGLSSRSSKPAGDWQQGASEVAGQVLLSLGAMKEFDVRIHFEEMALQQSQMDFSELIEELQEVDRQGKTEMDEARCVLARMKFQEPLSKQSRLLQEIAQERSLLRRNESENDQLSDMREQIEKAFSAMQRRQENWLEEERKIDLSSSEISTVREAFLGTAPSGSLRQILGVVLEAVAHAQWLAIASEMKSTTWKSLHTLETALHVPSAVPLEARNSGHGLPPVPVGAEAHQANLEAQVSALTDELHNTMAECKKHQLELQAFELRTADNVKLAEKRAASEAAEELNLWRKELFKTCGTWLHNEPMKDWHALALCREMALEHEVRDLASQQPFLQEHIAILAAQHEHLRQSAGCAALGLGCYGEPRHGREQVAELKSQFLALQEDLALVKSRNDVLERSLRRRFDLKEETREKKKASLTPSRAFKLEDVCPSLTSIAQELEQMVATRQSESSDLVLRELAKTKAWCEEVQGELRQQMRLFEDSSTCRADSKTDLTLEPLVPSGNLNSLNTSDISASKDSHRSPGSIKADTFAKIHDD